LARARAVSIKVSIHAPREGSDHRATDCGVARRRFNPRSPRGERPINRALLGAMSRFNPRSPRGERLFAAMVDAKVAAFQSTLPARGATQPQQQLCQSPHVSIHAPREGSDPPVPYRHLQRRRFNPRSPRGERRALAMLAWTNSVVSIHAPREGSDERSARTRAERSGFNPRSPRGERLKARSKHGQNLVFQSTLPARGATYRRWAANPIVARFQSTLPARGATCDSLDATCRVTCFNPRSPRGERPAAGMLYLAVATFQSTLPARGATSRHLQHARDASVSIHAPREGSDPPTARQTIQLLEFQSTLPARGAT